MNFSKLFFALIFLSSLLLNTSCAQQLKLVQEKNQFHKIYEFETQRNKVHLLRFKDSFTSVVFELKKEGDFQGVSVIHDGDTMKVQKAQHGNTNEKSFKSELIIFSDKTSSFKLLSKEKRYSFIIHLLDASARGSLRHKKEEQNPTRCSRPNTVPQSDWRKGLPAPTYDPIKHEVRHVIIHHSAGNTHDADTRSVVRNIYLHHTQVNGWSDIGYNFLIGINGKIFEGRDGMGDIRDSNVKGAHFCGKNSNTMGVCLIGNYEQNNPHVTSLNSLKKLLSWKMHKISLDPFAYYKHPDYASDPEFLGTIAGHKDGCATLCPGKNLYTKINDLKTAIADSISKCTQTSDIAQKSQKDKFSVYYHNGKLALKGKILSESGEFSIYNLQGQAIASKSLNFSGNSADHSIQQTLSAGIYVVRINTNDGKVFSRKVVVP